MKKSYRSPSMFSENSFATSALACGKTTTPPPGSHHFYSAYDTFTGHGEMGMGAWSVTGQFGVSLRTIYRALSQCSDTKERLIVNAG